MKYIITVSCFLFTFCPLSCAQTREALESIYSTASGDYAALFSGKIAVPYDARYYESSPYLYEDNSFREGIICFDGRVYKSVKLRLDVYTNSLSVLSPEKHHEVVPTKERVTFFTLEGERFVNYNGTYVREEFRGKRLVLYTRIYKQQDVPNTQNAHKLIRFRQRQQGILLFGGKEYVVNNAGALYDLFPEKKQEINTYVKEKQLKFNAQNRIQSLQLLVHYIDNSL